MPLIQSKSKKAFKENVEKEMSAGKPQNQSLAIAYETKRRNSKKMAKGGEVPSAKSEARPMPTSKGQEQPARNSGNKAPSQDQWTDLPVLKQARKLSPTPLSEPRMVASSVIKSRPAGMLKDQERHMESAMAPMSPRAQPKTAYNEQMAMKKGPTVPALKMKRMADGGEVVEDEAQDIQDHDKEQEAQARAARMQKMLAPAKKVVTRIDAQKYAKGGMINEDVSMEDADEDMVEHPAGLESSNDEMSPSEEEIMSSRMAHGGEVDEETYTNKPDNGFGAIIFKADGGMVDDEADMEHHDSVAAAIMAKRKRMAEGGQVDIDSNNEEQPNGYYARNEDAALKENYDQDMDDVSQPEDSNLMGHTISDEDLHDRVSKIMASMKTRKSLK